LLLEAALRTLLGDDNGVSNIVGSRIFPGVLPQTVQYPAMAYRLVSREHERRLEPRGSSGLARSRFRFFSTAKGATAYADAKRLDEALRLCLDGYHGVVSDDQSPASTLRIHGAFAQTTFDQYDDKTQTHQVLTDYDVWAEETQPTP
jgi:hypothetical protein